MARLQRLEQICHDLLQLGDVTLEAFGSEKDHVHLMFDMHPNIMPSRLVNNLKTVTSRLLRKEFSAHLKAYYWRPVLWTRAYCLVSAGGAPLEILQHSIQQQRQPEE